MKDIIKRFVSSFFTSETYLYGRFIIMYTTDMQPPFPFTRMRTATNFAQKK